MRKLWYNKPAGIWEQALPMGNGRIGGMVFSGVISDKIQINEETLWSGYPNKETRKHSMDELEPVRKCVQEGDYIKARDKTEEIMLDVSSEAYLTYGSLFLDILAENDSVTEYRRELDLEDGIIRADYKIDGIHISKEYFVSLKDDVMVLHVECSEPLDFHIYEAIELKNSVGDDSDMITVTGKCPTDVSMFDYTAKYDASKESVHFCSRAKVLSDKLPYGNGNSFWVNKAKSVTVIFSIKTSFNGYNKKPVTEGKEYINASLINLSEAEKYSYEELRKRHIGEYKKYFDRVSLKIDGEYFDDIPTDERMKRAGEGVCDNELACILFDYGRYLTISASMIGTQPMNLQGIWNQQLIPPWHSNYTMNINTQMNYWFTETVNLPECHMPLMQMLKELKEKGNNFSLNGWASWHNCDLWRFNYEAQKTAMWGFWPFGGFWTCRHIWEHYIHTGDISFLEEYYPVLTSAADFLEGWLYEKDGFLTTCPSTSPENEFRINETNCAVTEGSAMDISITYDLLDKIIRAGKILNRETTHYENLIKRLRPILVGENGCILEWGKELCESSRGHRHISHLYGFFPSDIWSDGSFDDAVRTSIEARMANGGGYTGWSNAWVANVYARLKDGQRVMQHIRTMFKQSIYPNMFDKHPPFQIDGNFGIASAICEALIQSHKDKTEFLPALPKEWKSGEVKGFITRNGEKVDFKWLDGEVKAVKLKNIY